MKSILFLCLLTVASCKVTSTFSLVTEDDINLGTTTDSALIELNSDVIKVRKVKILPNHAIVDDFNHKTDLTLNQFVSKDVDQNNGNIFFPTILIDLKLKIADNII